jgi:hypothetical protein
MPEPIEETRPTDTGDTQQPPGETRPHPAAPPARKRRRFAWLRLLILGWLILIVVAALGGYTGYQAGSEDRLATQAAQNTAEIESQYVQGLANLAEHQCDFARQRFEWVITQDPNHSGAIEGLAQALSCLNATATPTPLTPTPTPTVTPTPDLRGADVQFAEAEQIMAAGDWDAAINALFNLRKLDPAYRAVEVDSMLYVAFRNRGVDKILSQGELESGMYDLSQAELFGPLDAEATGYRNWARLYLIGATFFSVEDWAQAVFYLGQVAPFAPNLHDGGNGFAMDWYLLALERYINQLEEAKAWCTAYEQLQIYQQYAADPAALEQQLTQYKNRCEEDENG